MKYIRDVKISREMLGAFIAEYMEQQGYDGIAIMGKFKKDGSITFDVIGGNKEIKR